MNIKEAMKNSIKTEIECTQDLLDNFQDEYVNVVEALDKCEGKIIFVAVGKSGHIAKKLAATYASLGIPSFFVHATECMHGDLGMIEPKDIVIFVSNSGNTQEVTQVVPFVKQIGAKTIAFTGNEKSSLAMNCDMLIYYRKPVE
ncbi:MAG: SIS domain-containing protein, partial [Bacilli bacterium]